MSSTLPTPGASRLPRARWLDARLVVGLLLVLVSVVVGAQVVASADDTVPVWAASGDLQPTMALGTGDLVVARVHINGGLSHYLLAKGSPPTGYVLTRPVSAGELLPKDAIRAPGSAPTQLVTVPVDQVGLGGITRGSRVNVFAVPKDTGSTGGASTNATAPPLPATVTVVTDVAVAAVNNDSAGIGGGGKIGVVLVVSPEDAAKVVAAVSTGQVYLTKTNA